MKKYLSILLVLVMAVSLAACGGGQTAVPADPGGASGVTVGFSQIVAESDWHAANTESIKSSVADAGFTLIFDEAQRKQEDQIKALRDFVTRGVDVIAFSPVVESGWDEVIGEINDAGIPIILVDRATDIPGDDYYATFMGSDFLEEGRKAGKWLKDYMEYKGRGDDDIVIVELEGTVGSTPANGRAAGFREALKNSPNYNIAASRTGNFTRAEGRAVMEAFLKSVPRIDVLYAHNDDMALGAIDAIKAAGLEPGGDIVIIGVEAVRKALEAIVAGEMNCTVGCSPLLGPQLVDAINRLRAGETLPKRAGTDEYTYDANGEFGAKKAADEMSNRAY